MLYAQGQGSGVIDFLDSNQFDLNQRVIRQEQKLQLIGVRCQQCVDEWLLQATWLRDGQVVRFAQEMRGGGGGHMCFGRGLVKCIDWTLCAGCCYNFVRRPPQHKHQQCHVLDGPTTSVVTLDLQSIPMKTANDNVCNFESRQ